MKDQYFPGLDKMGQKEFGGTSAKGNPREKRPISLKKPVHLTMRSRFANGERSFLERERSLRIEATIHRAAKEHGVRIYRIAIVGNHLHLAILPKSRKAFNDFIRVISGVIARITLGRERGLAREGETQTAKKRRRFWDSRPYTRILEWGREFQNVLRYIVKNNWEAVGFQKYQPRKRRLSTA